MFVDAVLLVIGSQPRRGGMADVVRFHVAPTGLGQPKRGPLTTNMSPRAGLDPVPAKDSCFGHSAIKRP